MSRASERVFRSPEMGSSGGGEVPPPPQWLFEDLDESAALPSPSWREGAPHADAPGVPFEEGNDAAHAGAGGIEQGFAPFEEDYPPALEPESGMESQSWGLKAQQEAPPAFHPPAPPRGEADEYRDPPTTDGFEPASSGQPAFGDPFPSPPFAEEPAAAQSGMDSMPTRLENEVPRDFYSGAGEDSAEEADGEEEYTRPDLDAQFSHPNYSQPSVGQMGPPSRESASVPLYSHLGSELGKADPDSNVPIGRREAVVGPPEENDRASGQRRRLDHEDDGGTDASVLGWRVAGVSWLIFSALMVIPFIKAGVGTTTVAIFAPLALGGLALLTGWRWIGLTALGITTLYSMFFGFLGYLLIFDIRTLEVFGEISHLPPEYGIGMMVVGATFLFSNALLLVVAPEMGKAVVGALISLLPALGVLGFFLTADTKPRLREPLHGFGAANFQDQQAGFRFQKPSGWTVYSWDEILDVSRLGRGLVTEPDFYFVDESQDLLLAIYLRDLPRRSLADLLGGGPRTALEVEIIRGLTPQAAEPDEFTFKDTEIVFSEMVFEGALPDGTELSIIMDRAELSGKLLLVVMTRDLQSATTAGDAERQLNEFYRYFEFDR